MMMFWIRNVARISATKAMAGGGGPAAGPAAVTVRGLAYLQDQMKHREKVEEDRFMRAQDEQYLKRTREEHERAQRRKEFDELIRPTMVDLHLYLKQQHAAGGSSSLIDHHLSARQLEALARWKLGLPHTTDA